MRSLLFIFSSSLFLFLQASCKKYEPAPDAFFLKTEPVHIFTSTQQGTGSHKITDIWLYVNGQFQGSYPVGNTMPIVSNNKSVRINFLAGIKNNGIADTRIPWVFFDNIQLDTLVESGKTITRPLTFKYAAATTFTWVENFESNLVNGYTIEKSAISYVRPRVKSDAESLEGKYLEMLLSGDSTIAQVESTGSGFVLPKASSNVYLELNYKCTQEFHVGLIAMNGALNTKPVIYLKAQKDWNKIYIQLAEIINSEPVTEKHKIYFRMLRESSDPEARLCIDNIKLVYL